MIEFDNSRPLYLQVREDVLRRLESGEWEEGQQIPTESEMVKYYQTSRATVRHALGELESEGLIRRHPGIGTIVLKKFINVEPPQMVSFSEEMFQKGLTPKSVTVGVEFQQAPKRVREGFGLTKDQYVFLVRRLRLVNDKTMSLQDLYIPPNLRVSAEDLQNLQSYYKFLWDHHKIKPAYSKISMTATTANNDEADLLQVPPGEPLIFFWRVTFSEDNQPFEVVKTLFIAKRYEYNHVEFADRKTNLF